MTPSPLKGTIMLYNVFKFVASVILGYLSAYLLDLTIAHFQRWTAKKRFEEALTVVMNEDNSES